MGTYLLQGLVRTPPYKRVVALLGESAGRSGTADIDPGTLEQIADATLDASLSGFERAKGDPAVGYCLFLLTRIAHAAAKDDFAGALEHAGVLTERQAFGFPDVVLRRRSVGGPYLTVFTVAGRFTATVDRQLRRARNRTDLGEMAQLAATESLCVLCLAESGSLFGTSEFDVRKSLRRLATDAGFARLAEDYFARLTRRYLEYHLSRELSNHVGKRRRFAHVDEHNEFLLQLDRHCRVASSVLHDFAAKWHGLHTFRNDLTPEHASGFAAHALYKVREALRYQEDRNA